MVDDGPRELLTGRITVVNRTQCPETFVNRFCAGPSFFGGCQGDDGGAVIANGLLYGLIDYRSAEYCLDTNPVHLYVDVAGTHREWIETTVFGAFFPTKTQGSSKQAASVLLITLIALLLRI